MIKKFVGVKKSEYICRPYQLGGTPTALDIRHATTTLDTYTAADSQIFYDLTGCHRGYIYNSIIAVMGFSFISYIHLSIMQP